MVDGLWPEILYWFHEGTYREAYKTFGAHFTEQAGSEGVIFRLWAPNAKRVRIIGSFNDWQGQDYEMNRSVEDPSIWSLFVPKVQQGDCYKYEILTARDQTLFKCDPYGFGAEMRPASASKIVDLESYNWQDHSYYEAKEQGKSFTRPMNIYEVHLGSWQRKADGTFLTYEELGSTLIPYVLDMGYTHLELLPLAEHPLDESWGYQATGYYAVTSRYGEPQDFMAFVDACHEAGLGVILDWVPGHFCRDEQGLRLFDGTALYESPFPERADNHDWGTSNFDYGRPEVKSFLISNALFWFHLYHIDGLRVDAVASMLYLDYGRKSGEWTPNRYGGRENLEAIDLLRSLSEAVYSEVCDPLLIAEESTAWPLVTKPTYTGGLGFTYKWNMGWMNDLLKYMSLDPVFRSWNHEHLTFSLMYAFSENFILPLSHDEVVHGKKSLLDKMPGDYWQKFANLRAFYGYMMAHPGKKLLFMGSEWGQFAEWNENKCLDWQLLEYDSHRLLHDYVRQLNHFYLAEKALYELDHSWQGFEWIDHHDHSQSVIAFIRRGQKEEDLLLVVCNFTPLVRHHYCIGVPEEGVYEEVFNSDQIQFGGSGVVNDHYLTARPIAFHGRPFSLNVTLPPLGVIYLKLNRKQRKAGEAGCKEKNVLQ